MGIFDRVERRLERTVNGVFARAFKADVQPVEIASAIRKAMDDRAVTPSRGTVLVPNVFAVALSPTDYDRLSEFEEDILDELMVSAEEHVDSQHYSPAGPIEVSLERTNDLETGFFRVKPSKAKQAGTDGRYARPPAPPPPAPRPEPAQAAPRQDIPSQGDSYGADAAGGAAAGIADAPTSRDPGPGSRRSASREEQPRTVAPRRPRAGDRPYLAARHDRFLLMGAINVVGRDEESDIIFEDPGISRRHTEIRVTTDGPHLKATLRDLGSTNGTFVNGQRVSSQRLEDGDRITFGRTTVTYHAGRT